MQVQIYLFFVASKGQEGRRFAHAGSSSFEITRRSGPMETGGPSRSSDSFEITRRSQPVADAARHLEPAKEISRSSRPSESLEITRSSRPSELCKKFTPHGSKSPPKNEEEHDQEGAISEITRRKDALPTDPPVKSIRSSDPSTWRASK